MERVYKQRWGLSGEDTVYSAAWWWGNVFNTTSHHLFVNTSSVCLVWGSLWPLNSWTKRDVYPQKESYSTHDWISKKWNARQLFQMPQEKGTGTRREVCPYFIQCPEGVKNNWFCGDEHLLSFLSCFEGKSCSSLELHGSRLHPASASLWLGLPAYYYTWLGTLLPVNPASLITSFLQQLNLSIKRIYPEGKWTLIVAELLYCVQALPWDVRY